MEDLLWKAVQAQHSVYLSVTSWGEILTLVSKAKGEKVAKDMQVKLEQLPIELVPIDSQIALVGARLSAAKGLPYLDCLSLAAAQQRRAILVTTDAELSDEQAGVKVQVAA